MCVLYYVTSVTSYGRVTSSVMTIRLRIDDFLYVLNRNRIRIWLSFHDVITNVIN